MKGTPGHQVPEQVLAPGPGQRTLPELPQTASHLPGARRTHRKRRNHRDSHDVTNNILASYYILLRYVIVLSPMNLVYSFYSVTGGKYPASTSTMSSSR